MLRVLFLKEVEIGYFLICRKSGFGQLKLSRKKNAHVFRALIVLEQQALHFFFIFFYFQI